MDPFTGPLPGLCQRCGMMSDTHSDLDSIAREAYLEAIRLGLEGASERIAYAVVAIVQANRRVSMDAALEIARRVAAG